MFWSSKSLQMVEQIWGNIFSIFVLPFPLSISFNFQSTLNICSFLTSLKGFPQFIHSSLVKFPLFLLHRLCQIPRQFSYPFPSLFPGRHFNANFLLLSFSHSLTFFGLPFWFAKNNIHRCLWWAILCPHFVHLLILAKSVAKPKRWSVANPPYSFL